MDWVILVVSGAFEAVWAAALGASHGFTKWRPSVLFAVAQIISMGGLAWAMQTIPTGTAYAVWVGIGASLTVLWAFVTKQERPTLIRIGLLVLLIGSVGGLKVVS
ncbi:DMT family transporter [Parenemella sanctibonifatiensis]|uniref:Ligand-binding protein SH3 n=1 Tax=Parenemella sanctibonifatiensis TaxID=2016505 RepID=A0A255EIU5_9ACTN|nr:multidrug efflux SMR transporter [Parenemella sanctibonifatiensis]OYN91160.1 ligand-binding protein SH3 [Parenemella sanctibonifatiensis]